MPKLIVTETLERSKEVEVTDDELALLRQEGFSNEQAKLRDVILLRAGQVEAGTEWVCTTVTGPDDEELFDVG